MEPCDTWSDPCAVSCLREGSRGSAGGHTVGGPGPAPSRPLQTRGLRRDPHLWPQNRPLAPSTAAPIPDPSAPGPWTPMGTMGHAPGSPAGHLLPPQGTGGRRWAPVLQAFPGQRRDVCSSVTQSLPNGLRQRLASQQGRGAQHPRSCLHAAAMAYGHATWTQPASLMVTRVWPLLWPSAESCEHPVAATSLQSPSPGSRKRETVLGGPQAPPRRVRDGCLPGSTLGALLTWPATNQVRRDHLLGSSGLCGPLDEISCAVFLFK